MYFLLIAAAVLGNEGKVRVCLGLAKNFCADAGKLAAAEKQIRGIEANAAIVTVQGNRFSLDFQRLLLVIVPAGGHGYTENNDFFWEFSRFFYSKNRV